MSFLCNLKCQDENDYPANLQCTFHLNHNCPFSCSGCCTPFMSWSQRTDPPHPSRSIQTLPLVLLWAKGKIKTNRTLIRGSRFSPLSCWRKEPSPGRLPQIKASCLPLAALPMRIATTKPAETIIYSFWCGFWSYPTSSTMPPSSPSYPYPSSSSPHPSSFLYLLIPRKQGHACFSIKTSVLKEQQFQVYFFI